MSDAFVEKIRRKIIAKHSGDESQLEVIFSESERILVEAPAGYGKTNTMISTIAYMLATNKIPNPKRLLALTFSVNAAFKIKRDCSQQLPTLLDGFRITTQLSEKVVVSNYHGFCRNLLRKYGYLISPPLNEIDKFDSIDDSDASRLQGAVEGLGYADAQYLTKYNGELKNANKKYIEDNLDKYNAIVIRDLTPKKIIPFNAILSLTISVFKNHPQILEFYQGYFSAILVDEYQDTNLLSQWLLTLLVSAKSKVILMGDSLQRIYGFIGAIPDLMRESEAIFSMNRIGLTQNHRFAANPQMLCLDRNIRLNAEDPYKPNITQNALVNLEYLKDQPEEANWVLQKAQSLLKANPESK